MKKRKRMTVWVVCCDVGDRVPHSALLQFRKEAADDELERLRQAALVCGPHMIVKLVEERRRRR